MATRLKHRLPMRLLVLLTYHSQVQHILIESFFSYHPLKPIYSSSFHREVCKLDWLGESIQLTWDLDRFGFVKRPTGATTRQTPIDLKRGKKSEGCYRWRLVEREAGRVSLLCQWGGGSGLAKRQRRLEKKKERLSSFGQNTRGMTERGMREVVAGVFIPYCLTECLLERE
ncbi:hypothetical protein NC652_040896 [Populus alba x Populus x berolinensis]|nr:hypothetical protein NC652_040896 [Populus alba x Populus x berolinensis]